MITVDQSLREFETAFNAETKDFAWKAVRPVQRLMGLQALDRVVLRTPVDTGRTRGNWQTTIATPAESEIDRVDPTGNQAISAGQAVIANLPPFECLWFANNAPHFLVIENGEFDPPDPGPSKDPRKGRLGRTLVVGGYSVQAPQGVVAITVQELTTQFG